MVSLVSHGQAHPDPVLVLLCFSSLVCFLLVICLALRKEGKVIGKYVVSGILLLKVYKEIILK